MDFRKHFTNHNGNVQKGFLRKLKLCIFQDNSIMGPKKVSEALSLAICILRFISKPKNLNFRRYLEIKRCKKMSSTKDVIFLKGSPTVRHCMWAFEVFVHLTCLNLDSCQKKQNFALLSIGSKYTLVYWKINLYLTSSYPPFAQILICTRILANMSTAIKPK